MAQSYEQALAAAKERYETAMADSAADVLYISEKYDRPLQTICKKIAGDDWNALRMRAQRLAQTKRGKESGALDVAPWTQAPAQVRTARNVLKDPQAMSRVVEDLDYPTRVALAAAALDDDLVLASVQGRMSHQLSRHIEVAKPLSLDEQWESWIAQVNHILTKGARLAEQTEAAGGSDAVVSAGLAVYQRLTERNLDAELRAFFAEAR